jgi:spermidine synthase
MATIEQPPAADDKDFAEVVVTKDDSGDVADRRQFMFFTENVTPNLGLKMSMSRILFSGKSKFQTVDIIETKQFGRTLVMDGQTQSALSDEMIYHESLVHPAMLLHPNPKSVYIGGGGEFATAREVLRHKSVERCVMVDIDKLACDMCLEHLPEWNAGVMDDPRMHVAYTDAKAWLEQNDEKFDVIIMDIADPIDAGPGYKLYTKEFYLFCAAQKLNPGGIIVTQSGPGAHFNIKGECMGVIHNTLKQAFATVVPFNANVPSFGCPWGFNLATSAEGVTQRSVLDEAVESIDAKIESRIKGGADALRYYDGVAHKGAFGMPKCSRRDLDQEERVMTVDNPVFMFAE